MFINGKGKNKSYLADIQTRKSPPSGSISRMQCCNEPKFRKIHTLQISSKLYLLKNSIILRANGFPEAGIRINLSIDTTCEILIKAIL